MHGYEHSLDLCLPPLGVLVLRRDEVRSVLTAARDVSGS
jgi:1,4-alpha-glucan branching enzyme